MAHPHPRAEPGQEEPQLDSEVSDVPYRRTFVRLLGFLRPYRWSLLVSTILAVLSQAAAIAIVLLVGEAIDGIEAGRGHDGARLARRRDLDRRRSSRRR